MLFLEKKKIVRIAPESVLNETNIYIYEILRTNVFMTTRNIVKYVLYDVFR